MKLDLLRHGEALAVAVRTSDAERELSPKGREDVGRLGRHLAGAGWRPDRVFHSPLRRARQSADLLVETAGAGVPAEALPELDPERGGPNAVLAALRAARAAGGHVVLVGHQPQLGEMVALLAGTPVTFPPGGFVSLEVADGLVPGSGSVLATRLPDHSR